MKIFDWLNQITYHKQPWDSFEDEDKKTFNVYMINQWLSMEYQYIEVINAFQRYTTMLKPREIYTWYCSVLPKQKVFNKYIKRNKDSKYDKKLIEIFVKFFELGEDEITDYLDLLFDTEREDVVRTILQKFGTDKKTINRIIKNGKKLRKQIF